MITDDELLLYHYRDGLDAAERARIGAALSEPELARRLQALVSRLDAATAMPEVSVPEHTQRRWEAALELAAREGHKSNVRVPQATRRWDTRWLAAAAAVAIVAVVSIIQVAKQTPPERIVEVPVPTPDNTGAADASAYERGLKVHLASTERQIAELGSATPEQRARLIETIIAQNRIYALAAERAGEPQLARVLRAFSPILEDLVQGRGDSSASIAQLGFELRVMQGRLSAGADTSSSTQSTTL
jgi:hypothetical protein